LEACLSYRPFGIACNNQRGAFHSAEVMQMRVVLRDPVSCTERQIFFTFFGSAVSFSSEVAGCSDFGSLAIAATGNAPSASNSTGAMKRMGGAPKTVSQGGLSIPND
jgi:hypothetical protein